MLHTLDVTLFRLINQACSNPVFDVLMPFLSWNRLFVPAVFLLSIGLLWKGGIRGRVFVSVLWLSLALGDTLVINQLKHAVERPRPFHEFPDAHLLVGKGRSSSMPSSHAASWFAAAFIAHIYYRRSAWLMLPLAVAVAFARIYVGAHYPSDVLAGAILGAGYAAAIVWGLNVFWQSAGRGWFPEAWAKVPSLLNPTPPSGAETQGQTPSAVSPQTWLRLGYSVIALLFLTRLIYLNSDRIELSEDEAYQWHWSKHLALSYYSKPPLIAYAQRFGTALWGDNACGVRFLSPVIAAALSVVLLRFMARAASARAGFFLVLIVTCTPLLAVGSTLLTVDPLLVLFWTAAMVAGWQAVQPDGRLRDWAWVGLWMGLAFLSKYSAFYQVVSWAIFFALWPPARVHLRRPGPYLALFLMLLCTLPVVLWNAQHGWVTAAHVAENAKLDKPWQPTLRYFFEFAGGEAGLLNPVFFVAALWAMGAFWKRVEPKPLALLFFSMGGAVFLGHWLYSLHSRMLLNWIAPSVLPMFCLMVLYWDPRWRSGRRAVKSGLAFGLGLGLAGVLVLHDTDLIAKMAGQPLPPNLDPLRRVRGSRDMARVVAEARATLAREGRPVFIIGHHYGVTSQLSFYLPEAQAGVPQAPLVYPRRTSRPQNQFYFWPRYRYAETRQGQNAIYVLELKSPRFSAWRWAASIFQGEPEQLPPPAPRPPPAELLHEFGSVRSLGVKEVLHRKRPIRWVQLFECKNLH